MRKIKSEFIPYLAAALLAATPADAQKTASAEPAPATKTSPVKAEDAFGLWQGQGGARMEVYSCGDGACIRIARVGGGLTQQRRLDVKNPDAAKRKEPVLGHIIMQDGKRKGALAWGGRMYNPDDGKTYSSTVKPITRDTLQMAGCVMAVVCQKVTWTRTRA
jgi:uncharacterized protein (DUF2147 family)